VIFVLAGGGARPGCPMRFDADVGGVLDGGNFGRGLLEAQLGDQRRGIGDVTKRIAGSQLGGVIFGPRRVEARMGAERTIQLAFQFLYGQNCIEPSSLTRIDVVGRSAFAGVFSARAL